MYSSLWSIFNNIKKNIFIIKIGNNKKINIILFIHKIGNNIIKININWKIRKLKNQLKISFLFFEFLTEGIKFFIKKLLFIIKFFKNSKKNINNNILLIK